MCGIVGYIGNQQAGPILIDGLEKPEYRGYDSAGITVHDGLQLECIKSMGRLKILNELTQGGNQLAGCCGIGHTRWATHGEPSDVNAHPHFNDERSIGVVNNGIIENHLKLKKRLEEKGYDFSSETDTEVIAHLLDYYYEGDPLKCIIKTMQHMEGAYALEILFRDQQDVLYDHFMLKEIYEQPQVIKDNLNAYIRDGQICLDQIGIDEKFIQKLKKIYIIACGSAYHTGMAGRF